MKPQFFVTLALLALALPLSAAEPSQAVASVASGNHLLEGAQPAPLFLMAHPVLTPNCWDLQYTSCSPLGAHQNCTDGTWDDYVCVCDTYYLYGGGGTLQIWNCPQTR